MAPLPRYRPRRAIREAVRAEFDLRPRHTLIQRLKALADDVAAIEHARTGSTRGTTGTRSAVPTGRF